VSRRTLRLEKIDMIERSYLTQRFAKLKLGSYHVIGCSLAGEETVIQIPEMNVCFDIGRAPQFCLSSDYVCISHGHMDHLAGIAYYLSQKQFQGMKPGTVFLPEDLEQPVARLLADWRQIERQQTPFELIPMRHNMLHEIRRDFGVRALTTHHTGNSLGYSLISIREKLKQEYYGKPSAELAQLKQDGVEIQYRTEVPLITYLGDTTAGPIFDHPDVVNCETLITECTFFEQGHIARAKHGKHLHVEHLGRILPRLNCKNIILIHVSRRTGVRRAKSILRRAVHEELLSNVHFLMDFDDALDEGEIESPGIRPDV
jgi:ribonuclease Z